MRQTSVAASEASSQKLGEERTAAVRSYLVGKGIDAARIKSENLGEKEQAASKNLAQGQAQNLRVEIEIIGRSKP